MSKVFNPEFSFDFATDAGGDFKSTVGKFGKKGSKSLSLSTKVDLKSTLPEEVATKQGLCDNFENSRYIGAFFSVQAKTTSIAYHFNRKSKRGS